MSKLLPNVIQLGWGGDNGWGTSIVQTIYMTFWPAIFGGILGLIFGVALVVTEPGGILENKFWFNVCDKIVSIFRGKIEAAEAIGATNWDIIKDVYLREARSELTRVSTVTLISLVGLTAMAGAIGAGGLGNTAISYGYNRFNNDVTLVATLLVLLFVLVIQVVGDFIAKKLDHQTR